MIGVRFPAGAVNFLSLLPHPDRIWNPPSLLSNGYEIMETYLRSTNTSSYCGAYLSTQYLFMPWYLVKNKKNFAYYFTSTERNFKTISHTFLLKGCFAKYYTLKVTVYNSLVSLEAFTDVRFHCNLLVIALCPYGKIYRRFGGTCLLFQRRNDVSEGVYVCVCVCITFLTEQRAIKTYWGVEV
jgi:hypothetical protein